MRQTIFILAIAIFPMFHVFGQTEESNRLDNVLIVAQQDQLSDRYTLEGALMGLFREYGIKTKISLNIVKEGGTPEIILTDEVQEKLEKEGIDTYLLVSIRGHNNRFKAEKEIPPLEKEIAQRYLYELFHEDVTNVTFTFTFYKDKKPVHTELIRTGNVGSKEAVVRKMLKKVEKRLQKKWLNDL